MLIAVVPGFGRTEFSACVGDDVALFGIVFLEEDSSHTKGARVRLKDKRKVRVWPAQGSEVPESFLSCLESCLVLERPFVRTFRGQQVG